MKRWATTNETRSREQRELGEGEFTNGLRNALLFETRQPADRRIPTLTREHRSLFVDRSLQCTSQPTHLIHSPTPHTRGERAAGVLEQSAASSRDPDSTEP